MATKKKPIPRASAEKKTGMPKRALVMPDRIYANASPHSIGGVSMFDALEQINSETYQNFFSEEHLINRSVARLQEAGFAVLQVSPSTINFAGTQRQFEEAFNTTLVVEQREVRKPGGVAMGEFVECPSTDLPGLIGTRGSKFGELLEGIALEVPRYLFGPSMFPPLKAYWHLDVPAGISLGVNADKAHRGAITGKGIKVAMCDTGHFAHPFFAARGYRVAPVILGPGATNPLADEVGHGTGESANIFAVAPDVDFTPVKISFVNSLGGFNAAVGLKPQIITCSWGSSIKNGPLGAADVALAAAISAAVASGIVVVFSAGNGHFGFPGQHPDVISAGGTYMKQDESLVASDYASGFASTIYPGRNVPDLCGLVGMLPKAAYIVLPLEPGDQIDVGNAGSTWPNGDETASNDGWAAFSGTSAAAPQLAGAAALVLQACSKLTPAEVKQVLRQGARDVTAGHCFNQPGMNWPAVAGPDLATGTGLLDANKSVLLAKVKCLGPIKPPGVIPPAPKPVTVQPIKPIEPVTVAPQPPKPPKPIVPPVVNPGPALAASGTEVAAPQAEAEYLTLSQEDVNALSDMIIKSDFDLNS